MSVVMLSYGAKLVRTNQVAGPDLLAFVIYQLTLGSILTVNKSINIFFLNIWFYLRIFLKYIHRL